MAEALAALAQLATELSTLEQPDAVLELVVRRAAEVLKTPRMSLRVLDATGRGLLTTCRAGEPLHWQYDEHFAVGEGLVGWVAQERAPLRSDDAEADPRFQKRPGMTAAMGSFLGVPMLVGDALIGVLSSADVERAHFTAEHEQLLTVLAAVCAPYVEVARLKRLAHVDPLTGALNRRGLDSEYAHLFEGAARPSVVLVDADRFKLVNDTHGHAVGDEVLRRLAHVLTLSVRAGDAVVRLGGEEFMLVLPGMALSQAAGVAERARVDLQAATLNVQSAALHVTASFGVARREPGEPKEALLERADRAVYAAKQAGRNRVHVAQAPPPVRPAK